MTKRRPELPPASAPPAPRAVVTAPEAVPVRVIVAGAVEVVPAAVALRLLLGRAATLPNDQAPEEAGALLAAHQARQARFAETLRRDGLLPQCDAQPEQGLGRLALKGRV